MRVGVGCRSVSLIVFKAGAEMWSEEGGGGWSVPFSGASRTQRNLGGGRGGG